MIVVHNEPVRIGHTGCAQCCKITIIVFGFLWAISGGYWLIGGATLAQYHGAFAFLAVCGALLLACGILGIVGGFTEKIPVLYGYIGCLVAECVFVLSVSIWLFTLPPEHGAVGNAVWGIVKICINGLLIWCAFVLIKAIRMMGSVPALVI